jgi:hypothetical protein
MVLTEAPALLDSPVALDLLVLKVNLVLPASLAALVAQDQLDPLVDPDLKVNQARQVSPVALALLDLKEDPDPKVAQDPLAKMVPLVAQDLLVPLEPQEQMVVLPQFQPQPQPTQSPPQPTQSPPQPQLNNLHTQHQLSNRLGQLQLNRRGRPQHHHNRRGLLQLSPHSSRCNPPTDDKFCNIESIG